MSPVQGSEMQDQKRYKEKQERRYHRNQMWISKISKKGVMEVLNVISS